jgi:signal peptidase I
MRRVNSLAVSALVGALGSVALAGCGGGSKAPATASSGAPAPATSAASSEAVTTSVSTSARASSASPPNVHGRVPYRVKTVTMTPTYKPLSTVYYDPTRTRPHLGDVIVFYLSSGGAREACGGGESEGEPCRDPVPGLSKTLSMERVVGLPGESIAIRKGRVIRNGRSVPEPPTIACGAIAGCEFPKAIIVPAGHYYVMGDDRELYQDDSRAYGAVAQAAILGTVVADGKK